MRFSSRFFLYGPFVMLVALAASVMIYWWVAAVALAKHLDALNGREITPGVSMQFGSKRIAGFPFRLDAIFENFTLRFPGANGQVVWHTDGLATHTLTYASDKTIFEAAGPQDFSWRSDTGAQRTFHFTPGALRASAVIESGKLQRFDLDAISLAGVNLAAGRAQFHIRRDPAFDALDLVFDAQSIRFAGDTAAGFADGLSHVRVEGRLGPAAPFATLLAGQTDWRDALERWRAENGVLKVDQAALFWAKCQATSAGNLTLDERHHIAGSLAFSLADCDALTKQAARVTAQPRAHRPILTALAALAASEPPDANGALPITVVFKNGIVFVGPGKSLGANSYFEPVGLLRGVY